MATEYKCYCPYCDTGLGFKDSDIQSSSIGARFIVCPECNNKIVLPTEDSNANGALEADELNKTLNNPNKLVASKE